MRARLKPISDQVMVITGASSGIGLALARQAARAGAAVVLNARDEATLRKICDEINAEGGRAHAAPGDVGVPDDVARVARAAIARFGAFDTWVNNAGVGIYGELTEIPPGDHERMFRTNYFGVVNGSVEAARHFQARGGSGAIINLGSVLSDIGSPLTGAYGASKHAVKGFTDSLRMELSRARAPVSVTLIKPSSIGTPFPDHARNFMGRAARVPPPVYAPEVVADAILHAAAHPIRQIIVGAGGRPQVLAAAAAPGLADRIYARVVPPLSRRNAPPPAQDSLDGPHGDGEVRTRAYRARNFSVYTETQKHPGLTLGVGLAAAAAGALWLAARPGAAARAAR